MSTLARSSFDLEIGKSLVKTRPNPCFEIGAFSFSGDVDLSRWRRDPCCSRALLVYYSQNECLPHKLVCGPLSSQKFSMAKPLSEGLADSLAAPKTSTQNYPREPYFSYPCAFVTTSFELSGDQF